MLSYAQSVLGLFVNVYSRRVHTLSIHHSPVLLVVCLLVPHRGVPREACFVLYVVCPLFTPRGVPGEGFFVLYVVSPERGARGRLVLSCL